ncbi:hypothetical protein [Pseudomonas sp. S1_E04]
MSLENFAESKQLEERSLIKNTDTGVRPSSVINPALTPGSLIQGDPVIYKYHPQSTLALGRSFNPGNVLLPMRPAIQFTEVPLDHGAPSASFKMFFVQTEDQLDTALSLDSKMEASYLGAKASGSSTFKTSYSIKTSSIVVVAKMHINYGRFGLSASATLIDDAKALLTDPKKFSSVFGSRYVNIESRGASASVIISLESVSSDLKLNFINEFSAGGDWGDFGSGSARSKFELLFKRAAKQSRLKVDAMSTGGSNHATLVGAILALGDSANPVKDIEQALSSFMAQFNSSNAVPTEYQVAPMLQFGLDENQIDPWTDFNERLLLNYVREYRLAITALDTLPAVKAGTHAINTIQISPPETLNEIIQLEPDIRSYARSLAENHEALKNDQPIQNINLPSNFNLLYAFASLIESADTPPTLHMSALLTPEQIRAVLRAPRGKRGDLAKAFNPELGTGVAITYKFTAHYPFLTATEIVEYSDGTTREFDEFRYDGLSAYVWIEEPKGAFSPTGEDLWIEWFQKHTGTFKLSASWKLRDKVGRVFIVRLMDVEFEAQNGALKKINIDNYY